MVKLEANTVDAAQEKHVPYFEKNGDKLHVQIGSVEHPMLEEHHIEWIAVETPNRMQRYLLKPVSYTHLDVYKRQHIYINRGKL